MFEEVTLVLPVFGDHEDVGSQAPLPYSPVMSQILDACSDAQYSTLS